MTVVSAFLVSGSPLPQLQPSNPPWGRLAQAFRDAGAALAQSKPDVILIYSTQWMAVLDQLWITRQRSAGLHVDENWHEMGEQSYDIVSDTELAHACVQASPSVNVNARGVDYDAFPIDTGTITACELMGMGRKNSPLLIASNNLYHDAAQTEKLSALAVQCAAQQGKRVAAVGVGGLSGSAFRKQIDIAQDHIVSQSDDQWNRRMLDLMSEGKSDELKAQIPEYAKEARVDMGFKHFHWLLGALGGRFSRAKVHGYEPLYGSGGAVVQLFA